MSEHDKTDPERMTVAELQAEIGRLTMVLQRKILGDPRKAVTISVGGRWHAMQDRPLLAWPRPAATTMSDGTILAEIEVLGAEFDRFRAGLEDCGHGGSPGEWMVERLDELETEHRRRTDGKR